MGHEASRGAVFGVVDNGAVTVAVYGIANLNTGLPVVRETLFQAGSIGKTYTATAIMQFVDDGRLDLDAPATRVPARPRVR